MKYYFFIFLATFSAPTIFCQNLTQLSYAELDSLLYMEYYNGAYNKAIPYIQAGREKAKAEFGEMDSVFATYTAHLGFFYKQMSAYEKAEPLLLQAKKIHAKVLGEQHPEFVNSLNNLANLYKAMSFYDKAEPLYLQAINIFEKNLGKDHPDYSAVLNDLAGLYGKMGNYEKAEDLFLQVIKIESKTLGTSHPYFAGSLNNLAELYIDMGNYDQAEPLFLQALNIEAKTLGEKHPTYAATLGNLAVLYKEMGNYEKAESLYLKALKIDSEIFGENHPEVANNLNNLAMLYQKIDNYAKAEKLYIQALNIIEKVLGKQHIRFAVSLNNLANLYRKTGDYAKAEAALFQANNIASVSLGAKHPIVASQLNNLAELYLEMNKLDTALVFCQNSIIARCTGMDSSFQNWENLDQFTYSSTEINHSLQVLLDILYTQYQKTGNKNKLQMHYAVNQAAMRLNERIRNEFGSEGNKLNNLALVSKFVLVGIQSGRELQPKGYIDDAFDFAEMNKGVLLMDAAKTAHAHKFGDLPNDLAIKEMQLQKKQADLNAKILEKRPITEKDSLLSILNKTNLEIDDFTKKIKAQYPKYAALKYQNKTARAKEIQALLDEQTALLEYVIGDSLIYIFYIDKNQITLTPKPLYFKDLTLKIQEFHEVLSSFGLLQQNALLSYQKYTTNAYWFYQNLVVPVFPTNPKNAKQIKKLIIVTDGELGHLPFEAFLVEPAPQKETDYKNLHYLVNDYQISYNYSATLWKANKEIAKQSNNGQLFALAANYNILLDSTKKSWRLPAHQRLREGLLELPEAQKEVQTLAESFNGFFAFDKDASEKNFKEKAGDYAVIHLAMHGLLDAKNPILSSLAFTEDGDSLENNFLQAYEISKMKLNADLVVLSACETGYGRFEKGNGIASLAQAFAYAGAPAMIVSLWQVNDYATSEIMKNLYQNLANGMEKDQALQAAKIQYLKEAQGIAAHPAFWSPFVLMGNTDAVYLKQKINYWTWGLGGLGVLAVVGLGIIALFFKSKKKESAA